jgi:oxygen-independent coproporphyrinogen-3 oxidase
VSTPSAGTGVTAACPAHRPAYRHVYLHVPFCARRCSYCDFAIAVRREVPWRAFADAVARECDLRGVTGHRDGVSTLYLGGGTPSRLGPSGVRAVFDALLARFTLAPDAEVTLEANPEDVTPDAVAAWRAGGVTRLSLGVQSFDDTLLAWMHRVHDAAGAERAVQTARDGGIDAFSLDLIFATPDRFVRDWDAELERLLSLAPAHVSLYGLTVEPHTPLGRWHARGEEHEASEDRYAREFLFAHERLSAAGFEHYEVSNFGRPGHRARHNSAYWHGVPYLGLGPSAHGFDGQTRRWNVDAYAAWERTLLAGHDPLAGDETLSDDNRAAEAVYLGLRTIDGLSVSTEELDVVAPWVDGGWVTVHHGAHDTRLVCSAQGWLRLDALAAALTAFRSRP